MTTKVWRGWGLRKKNGWLLCTTEFGTPLLWRDQRGADVLRRGTEIVVPVELREVRKRRSRRGK